MNEVYARIIIRSRETGETITELGEASHVISDPGEDVQSVHGWRNYVAERVALAVKATVASALTREIALQSVPVFTAAEMQAEIAAVTPAATPEIVFDLLLLVAEEIPREAFPTLEEISGWDPETLEAVATWAASHHAFASDNEDVTIPPVPAVLQGEADDETNAGDDAGAEGEAGSAAGAPSGGGQGAPGSAGGDAAGEPGATPAAEAKAPGADAGGSGGDGREAHAGSGGAAEGDEGHGADARPRSRRRRSGEEGSA